MKKVLSLLLATVMLLSTFCITGIIASAKSTMTLAQLQAKFPEGAYWNHYVSNVNEAGDNLLASRNSSFADSVSWTPCYSHTDTNVYNYVGHYDCNYFYLGNENGGKGGLQCMGFALKLASDAYGGYPYTNFADTTNKSQAISMVKPGDVIHYFGSDTDSTYGHWVFVTKVSGSNITVAECNRTYPNEPVACRIRWGTVLNMNNFYSLELFSAQEALSTSETPETYDYTTKYQQFISDSRWKNNASWGNRSPYLSSYSSSGCCAYAADYAYYVHGKPNFSSCSVSYNAPEIRTGDVVQGSWASGAGPHWIVVLSRNGNSLYTAEGNFDSKVRITNSGYTISGSNLYEPYNGTLVITKIYHFEISTHNTHSYSSSVTKKPTCTEKGVKTFSCSCGSSYTESIPATGHTPVTDKSTKPTCTQNGLTEGSHCSVCNAVITAQESIPALGHDYHLKLIYDNGNTISGTYHCSRCGTDNTLSNQEYIWSDYSEEKPSGIEGKDYKSKMQYRIYAPKPSEWQDTPIKETEDKKVETRTVYSSKIYPQSHTYPRGDFDKDGNVTVTDALAALRIAAKLAPETPEAIAIGDMDGDGHISVTDALAILRIAAKLDTPT